MNTNPLPLGKIAFKISFGGYLGWQMAKLVDIVITSTASSTAKGLKAHLEAKKTEKS